VREQSQACGQRGRSRAANARECFAFARSALGKRAVDFTTDRDAARHGGGFVQIREQAPDADMAQIRRLSASVFVEMLELWMRIAPEKYLRLFQICGFFETVGYSIRAGYITLDDIHQLFGVSIIAAATVFRPFIQKLPSEGADRALYENFLWLASEIEKRKATCQAP
jgi:hypothetical protein